MGARGENMGGGEGFLMAVRLQFGKFKWFWGVSSSLSHCSIL